MSKPSRQSPISLHEPPRKSPDSPPPTRRPSPLSGWATPRRVNQLGWATDFLLIVIMAVLADMIYQYLSMGTATIRVAAVGIGGLVSINFLAIYAGTTKQNLGALERQGAFIRECLKIWLAVFAVLAVLGFTMKVSSEFSRGATILFFGFGATALIIRRLAFAHFVDRALKNGWFIDKKVIVLVETEIPSRQRALRELKIYGLRPVKVFEFSRTSTAAASYSVTLDKVLAQIIEEAQRSAIEDIYICLSWQHQQIIERILHTMAVLPVSIHLLFDDNAARLLNNPVSNVGPIRTVELARQPLSRSELFNKRVLDLTLASTALVMLSPLIALTAVLIKLDSRGPVLFRQRRNGFNDKAFAIYKFRSMTVMEDGDIVQQTTKNDPRVTRLGRWLRRSSIDELPQLLNVLRGDMSIVGPRPHAAAHNTEYGSRIVNYAFRHHVKPGITGWAQVKGYRGETQTLDLMERRIEHDLWYINNWSLALDCKIIVMTMLISFRQESAY
jgi:Undecaprenyl-phosphate glucose phosphotransferase